MKFTADRDPIKTALAIALRIAPARANIPILGCVLLEVSEDGLMITATDLDQSISVTAKVNTIAETGTLALDAQRFAGAVASLPEGADFSFEAAPEDPRASLKSGRSHFRIPTLPAVDFPIFPAPEGAGALRADVKTFGRIMGIGGAYVDKGTKRTGLDMAHFHAVDDKFRVVSTNGHRLIWCEAAATGALPPNGIYIPDKSLASILAILPDDGDADIAVSDRLLAIDVDGASYRTKLGGDGWVNYSRVVPARFPGELRADTDLIGAVVRAGVMADERSRSINLDVSSGRMRFSARNESAGQADDEIDVDYDGPDFSVAFDVDYFKEAIDRVEGENTLIRFTPGQPGPFSIGEDRASDWFCIVMPKSR